MSVPVSILIPVRNEARNLPRALASVRWADEVWVVDSGSADGTVELAEKAGAKVAQFNFNGTWPKKKNWALANIDFATEWVFILDADEELPPEAEVEFRAIVSDPKHPVDGYWINRRFVFMGRWMRHAYYPNWNMRLFRHRLGRYEKLTDAATDSGDNEVHEHLVVTGETGRLKVEMNHYPYPDVATFVEKHNRYSNWEARVAVSPAQVEGPALQLKEAGLRRKLRRLSLRLPFRPFLRFCYVYFAQRGFLDGREGWYFSRLHGYYEFLSVAKTYELRLAGEAGEPEPVAVSAEAIGTVRVLGLPFTTGEVEAVKNVAMRVRGLVTAPSAPCLSLAARDSAYAADLAASVLVLPDSGAMVLMWRLFRGDRLRRVSGLVFLQAVLADPRVREPGALFLVDPSAAARQRNREYLKDRGVDLESSHQYVAPMYPEGDVTDPELLELLHRARPRYVLVNLGGGVQERLGAWLQANWETGGNPDELPAIFCTGAAIAFLTGEQTGIPAWADRLYLGWALRCLSRPGLYIPRYLGSVSVLYETWRSARAAEER